MTYRYMLPTIVFVSLLYHCSGTCTFPSGIRGSWISSEKNDLVFGDSSLSGYRVHTFSTDIFTCEELSGTQYLVRSDTFTNYGLQFYAYMCLDFSEIESVSTGDLYTYYKASPAEAGANNERVVFKLASIGISGISEVCTISSSDYSTIRYSVLMKNDTIANVKSKCPLPFLGNFAYSYDTGSGNLCPNDSSVTVCSGSKDTMTWDYTQCSQIQAYSAVGVTYCVYSSVISDVYTVHVYNSDTTTDQSTTYRFTCYQASGYSTVYAAQYPGDCPDSMNYSYVASPGATLSLNASVLCAYDDEETLSAGVIAAIVLACLFIIILAVAAIVYYLYYRRKKRKEAEYEAANRKVDPDALSPNMRLGLPDESKYDMDRLMYSPDAKNGLVKRSQRKDMATMEGLEGYNEGERYMDEDQRQTALDAHLFAEKRKRKDNKNEFDADLPANKQHLGRVKDMAKGKRRPLRQAALAKLRLKPPKARPMGYTPSESGRATQSHDVVIQVEEAEGEGKRKTRFADEEGVKTPGSKTPGMTPRKEKKLEDIDTLSDIVDNELGVDDLSDDNKEPRLILPNLKPEKKEKQKRQKDPSSLGRGQPMSSGMPHNTRFVPSKLKHKKPDADEEIEPAPILRGTGNLASLTPLARIHRKDNPRAWKDAFGDKNFDSCDIEEMKKNLPENRWKKLLEELYRDKKYFDYVKKSTSTSENGLFSSADESLQYLYGRALFWENQQPIPARPPSHVKRMYSRHDSSKPASNTNNLVRSSTTRSSRKQIPRTPSTQVGRLKKREAMDKKAKNSANEIKSSLSNGLPACLQYFEGGTQTDFSPVPPMTPVMITDDRLVEELDLTSFTESAQGTPAPYLFSKEITRSDILLEEFDEFGYQQYDAEEAETDRGTGTIAV